MGTPRTLNPLAVKRVNARVLKAAGQSGSTLNPGEFEAIVSVFGNVDSYGDVMVPGAFVDTLAAWEKSGNPIPVIWSHDWNDPDSHIGYVLDAQEVPAAKFGPDSPAGLYIKGANDIDTNARALQVSRLMAGGRITQFSFAYEETDAGYGVYGGMEAWLIKACGLIEVGPTLLGANQETTLIGAKRTIIDLASAFRAGSKAADLSSLKAIHDACVDLGIECAAPGHVPSEQNDTKQDAQGSTDGAKDAGNGDVGGASKLRTGDVRMSLDLLLADVS